VQLQLLELVQSLLRHGWLAGHCKCELLVLPEQFVLVTAVHVDHFMLRWLWRAVRSTPKTQQEQQQHCSAGMLLWASSDSSINPCAIASTCRLALPCFDEHLSGAAAAAAAAAATTTVRTAATTSAADQQQYSPQH
jgi:hypothetical protein